MMILDLVQNIAILLALCMGYTMVFRAWDRNSLSRKVFFGLIFGAATVVGMLTPVQFSEGIIFDGRSILLCMAGLFGGGLPALIAALIAAACRIVIGGAGMYTGCGVIVTSAVLGAGFRFRLRGNTADLKNAELFLFGGVVHIAMLFWMVTLPAEIRWQVIRSIALPVLLVYPLGTLLVGRILAGLDKIRISENAVRESEEEFRSLAESMPQIVWATRADGWTVYFNQQWVDYTGMTLEESYGHGWNAPFHPDDRQRAWDAWEQATQNNATYSLECRLRRFDGTYRWWLVRGVPQLNAAGETVKWYGTCTDIEQIKQADEEHQETRTWLAAALESMTDAVFISDADGNFIETNHAFASFHRFKEEECAKTLAEYHDILDVYFPNGEKAPLDMWAVPRALRGEIGENIEYSLRRKDTGETWVGSYCFAPIRDPNGAITGSVVVGRDITEKKHAQQKLLDSEARFNIAADAAAIGIWELDLRTEQLIWDDRMFPLYGISPNDFSGAYEAWHSGLHPEDRQRAMDETTAAISGEKEYDTEFRIIRPDGEIRHIRAYGQVIRAEDGTPLRMIGTNHDITEQHEAQESLRESETRLRAILDATPFPIALVDVNDDKVDFWSRSAHSLFGQTAPTAAEWFEIAYPDPEYQRQVVEQWKPALESARASDRAVNTGEYRITCEDGSIRICELFVMFLPDRLVITFNDITSRKKSEEELSASEERFRTICERAPVLIDGFDENGRCTLWNEQCRKTFGWTFEEVAAHPNALELFYPDPDVRDDVLKSITTLTDEQFREWQPQTKDGQVLTALWANLLLPNGQVYSIGQDITENRRLEQELANHSADLEHEVDERTYELRQIVNAMAGRENRMAELKEAMASLHAQLREAGIEPIGADSEGAII